MVPDALVDVVVPDSSYLHPTDPDKDGQRPAAACSPGHADELIAHGKRTWIDDQLWAGKLRRATWQWDHTNGDLEQFAELAGLTPVQLTRAIDWRTRPRSRDR